MMRLVFPFFFVVLAVVVGCSKAPSSETASQESATLEDSNASPGFAAVRPTRRYDDPRVTVNDFLVAVRSGEDESATALLTTEAQREAWTNGMAISGDGFPDAKFEVTEVEYLKENTEAHVLSTWENRTEHGEAKSFQCVWLLRNEPHGWCVYGMATKFLDHLQPIVLNFENQAEMQKRQQWAQNEIQKHAELQQHQQMQDGQAPAAHLQQAARPSTSVRQ